MKTSELLGTDRADALVCASGFSLVLGGPLYRLYLQTRLARPPLELVRRRIACLVLMCWLPLLVLAASTGHLLDGRDLPFLFDLEVQIKLLVALPLLIWSEVFVHWRIPIIVRQFIDCGIILPENRPAFAAKIKSAALLLDSVPVEVCLLVAAVAIGHWTWSHNLALAINTWYGLRVDGRTYLTVPGYWYAFISLPVFRFLLLRWYFRIFVWYRFLWHVRALPLHLNLFHPDRAAGLGFLSSSLFAIAPTLIAQTILVGGMIGERIWHAGAALPQFKMEIACAVFFLMLVPLAPLSFFADRLIHARLTALREFGILASRYADSFRLKWIQDSDQPPAEPLLGTSDIQSLADLGNSYAMVSGMRILPFSAKAVLYLAILIAAPLAPLALTMVPLERVVNSLIKLVL